MSSLIWDIAQDNLQLGHLLNDFLYEGKVKNNIPKQHTEEEYREQLESIRQLMFDNYNKVADSLGWR